MIYSTTKDGDDELLTVTLSAREKVYFHLNLSLNTGSSSSETEFYIPGFWHHCNMRHPKRLLLSKLVNTGTLEKTVCLHH